MLIMIIMSFLNLQYQLLIVHTFIIFEYFWKKKLLKKMNNYLLDRNYFIMRGNTLPYVHWDWNAFVIGVLGIKIKHERERERGNGVAAPTTLNFIPFSFHTRP